MFSVIQESLHSLNQSYPLLLPSMTIIIFVLTDGTTRVIYAKHVDPRPWEVVKEHPSPKEALCGRLVGVLVVLTLSYLFGFNLF